MPKYAHYQFSSGKESIWLLDESGTKGRCLWLDSERTAQKHSFLRVGNFVLLGKAHACRTDYDENGLPDDLCVKIATRALLNGDNYG
jgi:hypothetical protein